MAVAADAVAAPATPRPFVAKPLGVEHIKQLRRGGMVLYVLHGATDGQRADAYPVVLEDCERQRPLSLAGRAQLELVKTALRQLQIPVRETYSSPYCRALESAYRIFGEPIEVDRGLRYTATLTHAEKQPVLERTQALLSEPLKLPSTNRAIVGHGSQLAELLGYFPSDATVVVFRPSKGADGQGFEYVASIQPEQWQDLLDLMGDL